MPPYITGYQIMRTIHSLVVAGALCVGMTTAFLPPPMPSQHRMSSSKLYASTREKPLSWQESLELLLSPTTSLSQRQILFQNVVARAPEIRKDVEDAIKDGSVDGLLTDGVKAVRRQLKEDIIPNLASSEPQKAAKMLLDEIPKFAKSSLENLPRNPKDLADAVREISSTLPSEARNVFLKTPEGLETPHYHLLAETEEVRKLRHLKKDETTHTD